MTPDGGMLVELAWKSLIVAGLAAGLLRLARGRSAGERSALAHLSLLALVALPAAAVLLPDWAPLPASSQAPAGLERFAMPTGPTWIAAADEPLPTPETTLVSLATIAWMLYLLPVALLLVTILIAVSRLFAMRGRAAVLVDTPWPAALAQAQRRMGFKHGTALLVSDELRSPISWGVIRPTIVLDRRVLAATGEAEAIIAHELAHVAKLDWAKLLVSRVACALFWFNPLVWWLARESHQLREEAADDAVLLSEIDGADYATLLVNAARHDNRPLLLAAHGVAPSRHSLKRRIARVLDRGLRRGPATGGFVVIGVVALVALGGPLAAFDPGGAGTRASVAPAEIVPAEVPQLPAITVVPQAPKQPADRLARLTPERLTRMRAVRVSPAYVRSLRHAGVRDLSVDEIVQARAVGLSPTYLAEMRALFPAARLSQLTAMRAVGVTADYVRDMRAQGMRLDEPNAAVRTRVLGPERSKPRVQAQAAANAAHAHAAGAHADGDLDLDPDIDPGD